VKGFCAIFRLEFLALVRSRALAILAVLSLAWMFLAPHIFRADGTAEGARELCVRFSLGGVTLMLAVVLLVSAAGSLARERAAKRLQLTLVRPVRRLAVVGGKILALSLAGALVLALAASVEWVRQKGTRRCNSVYRPILPSPAEEAKEMYAAYMADPETPPYVKNARKSVVMRLLTQRALDHFQTIQTNDVATWRFNIAPTQDAPRAVRFRFTNPYEMRDVVRGSLTTTDGYSAPVSNITQAVITIPLHSTPTPTTTTTPTPTPTPTTTTTTTPTPTPTTLSFSNHGNRPLMLRPRKDVEFLVAADSFAANLLRAYLELVALLTLLVSFGVFLGSVLSRPVAVFVAIVTLALSEMSPSVLSQYPDALETDRLDAIGLSLARFTAAATHPIGSLSPLSALAADERIEPRDLSRVLLADLLLLPLLLSLLSATLLPRKQSPT